MKYSVVSASLLLLMTCAQAQRPIDPVAGYLDQAERGALNVLNEAGAQGKGVAMTAAQGVLSAIALFRQEYSDSLKETVSALGGERYRLFQDIRTTTDALNDTATNATEAIERTSGALAMTVSNLPFTKDIPRVTRVYPLFSVATDPKREFAVKGLSLTNAPPTLRHGKAVTSPVTAFDTELRFAVPPHDPVTDRPVVVPSTVQVFERKTKWVFFDDFVPKTYPVQLVVYPKVIGPATLTPRLRTTRVETVAKVTPRRCESPRGEGIERVAVSVTPTPGYLIDVSSVEWRQEFASNGVWLLESTTPTGITARLVCTGTGKNWVDAGSIGSISGRLHYTESRSVPDLVPGPAVTFDLSWGESRVDSWPENTETVILQLNPFRTGRMESIEGSARGRFAVVEYNPQAKTTRVTARPIELVMREP